MTADPKSDVVGLLDLASRRLADRLAGLDDDEWSWCPTSDRRIGIRWRLDHIAALLGEPRNWTWLGHAAPTEDDEDGEATTAAEALALLGRRYAAWRELLTDPDLDLATQVGAPGGRYADSTRLSFVLHVADELVHHAAEVALLRDLYADH
jgi:uncharacterized damage-inducible protein DinB